MGTKSSGKLRSFDSRERDFIRYLRSRVAYLCLGMRQRIEVKRNQLLSLFAFEHIEESP